MTGAPDATRYASFALRVRAMVVDGVVVLAALLMVIFLVSFIDFGATIRIGLFFGLILGAVLYEPMLVALRGATVGHQLCNLRVVAPTPTGRLAFWRAGLRWLLKAVTGLASFGTMAATERHQALHDLPFGTTVQLADPARGRAGDYVLARSVPETRVIPGRLRRATVVVAYLLLLLVALIVALSVTTSVRCFENNWCSDSERLADRVITTAWLAASVAVCALGWKGRLVGARGRPAVRTD